MDEALGVDPTERVIAEAELASVVGDDDGLAEQALGHDRPPQRRFAGRPYRIGRHCEIGEAERAQVLVQHSWSQQTTKLKLSDGECRNIWPTEDL
jgi:hypothetical protein